MTDTLLFRHQQPPPPPAVWLSISFSSSDQLHLVDAPTALTTSLVSSFPYMIQRSGRTSLSANVFEIKFRGNPWRATGTETMQSRMIVLTLLEVLEEFGYSLYASVDQENGSEGREADTWYCCRQAEWEAGLPVYHA